MEDVDIAIIRKKSLSGVLALVSRTFFLQVIAFGATFLLTIFLSPAIFGIFYVVSAIISFMGYFSDIGLAAALIQKKEALSDDDLMTTFTIQQGLVTTGCIIVFFLSPWLASFYGLDASGAWLMRALVIAFFISSLKTIPSIILERKLEFGRLVIPQLIETVGFYGVAVILAWKGMGITSFTWAVLVRAVTGLVAMYIIAPWKIRIGISPGVARKLLRFGIPFQLNSLLALVKDDLMTILLGKLLPFSAIGYIGWAKKWAEVPLRLIMDSVIRVTFPAFSRLQHSRELLGNAIGKTMFGLASTIFPLSVGLLFYVGPMISIIPKYAKWEPAIPSFMMFVFASILSAFSTPLTNALNAVGKIRITLYLMIFWTTATWILTLLFIHLIGFNGVALAQLLLTTSIVVVLKIAKRTADFSLFSNIRYALLGATVMGVWIYFLLGSRPYATIRLISVGVSGAILYAGILWAAERSRIRSLLVLLKH